MTEAADMGLPWVRLDVGFPTNPKVLVLIQQREGHRAGFVYLCALAFAGQHGTDGFIAEEVLPFIHGRSIDARLLVKVGLWEAQPGGWLVHGWMDKQQSTEETHQRRVRAQAAAQAGAAARWNGHESSSNAERQRAHRERKKEGRNDAP